jgi:16S rRNA (guanine527-N7)-methyltransferase
MPEPPLTADDVAARCAIATPVLARLSQHVDMLATWQRRINLVGKASLNDVWRRHVLDSAQLMDHLPRPAGRLVDLGSGAGFPGLVLAILGAQDVHLIESDARKCAFLAEVNRATGAGATIHTARLENLDSLAADIVVGRALAPLDTLIGQALHHLAPGGRCLFHKGRNVEQELTESSKNWKMRVSRIRSISDPSGTILDLEDIRHRHRPRS